MGWKAFEGFCSLFSLLHCPCLNWGSRRGEGVVVCASQRCRSTLEAPLGRMVRHRRALHSRAAALRPFASPGTVQRDVRICGNCFSHGLQGMFASEKSKGMEGGEEGMDLADEVNMGGKVCTHPRVGTAVLASVHVRTRQGVH